jgi:hypothetical protein
MPTTYHCPSHIRAMLANGQRKAGIRLAQAWRDSLQPILKDGDEVEMPDLGSGKLGTANKYPRRPRCVSGANRPR